MKLFVNWKTAFKAITKNGKRSFLTMIGIIIGIAAVITIMAVGQGFEKKTIDSLTNSEKGEVNVTVNFTPEEGIYDENRNFFSKSDLNLVKNIPGVKEAGFPKNESQETYVSLPIRGKNQDLQLTFSLKNQKKPMMGRTITKADELVKNKVVTIDHQLAKDLYGKETIALGRGLEIQGEVFQIVGIYKAEETLSMFSLPSSNITMTKNVYNYYFPPVENSYSLELTLKTGTKPNEVTEAALKALKENGSMKDKGEYSVFDMSFLTDGISQVMGGITAFISAIAGISLFIAGVGVMNMMYISVSERTKEIGIRRALGATQRAIMLQFLLEGISLTLVGGIIGYVLGMLLAYLVGGLLKIPITIDLFTVSLAVGISTLVGLIFSVFPARQAAKKDLIDILR